jgi:putative spermidine/putrescine transport system permease protein
MVNSKMPRRFWIVIKLLPATAVLVLLFVWPLVAALLQSFGYAPLYGLNTFPDFSHYQKLLTGQTFWQSLGLSFYYALVPTFLGTILSIFLALLLRKKFRGKRFFSYLYKLPLVLPYLLAASLAVLFLSNGGLVARVCYALGLIDSTGQFPRLLYSQWGWGVIAVYVWKQVPFTALVVSSVLTLQPKEHEEIAVTFGASTWQMFRHVTLPHILPGVVSATLIVFAFNFGSFEVPFLLGSGFPNTLSVMAWRTFDNADYSGRLEALAIIMTLSLVSSLLLFSYLFLYRRFEARS